MNYKDFIDKFHGQISSIDHNKQLSLGIEVSKKLFPDYVEFSEKYKWGNQAILKDSLAILERSKVEKVSRNELSQTLVQIDKITPDMEDFHSDYLASYALNACVAIRSSIQFLIDRDSEHIFEVGLCLTDSIDFKIQEHEELTEQEIDKNPLMLEAREYLLRKSN